MATSNNSSNYDAVCDAWRNRFLTWDHVAQMENLGLPGLFDDRLELTYFGVPYQISRQTGMIENLKFLGKVVPFNEQMSLYHILWYSKKKPKNSGIWVPFRQVKGAAAFDSAFQRLILRTFADTFAKRIPALIQAGQDLGHLRIQQSDVGFYVEAFSCVPLKLLFWDADDEFPAQANLLFDQNITDFLHEETVVTLAQDCIHSFFAAAKLTAANSRYD